MNLEEWWRRLGSADSYSLRGMPNTLSQWKCVSSSCLGERAQGRLALEAEWRSENHASVPRLWRHVHGALPQHHARIQRNALAVGTRRIGHAVFEPVADSDPETAGSHVYGPR